MRIRRRPTDVHHHRQAPSSSQGLPAAAAPPFSATHPPTPCCEPAAVRWAQPPALEVDPPMCRERPFDPRPPSRSQNRQEEGKEEVAKTTEGEKIGKEDGKLEPEPKRPVHVVRSTPTAPKPEEEDEGRPTEEVGEKKSKDSRRDVKADEENSTAAAAMCKKGDGKGWHCKRLAQIGHSLCQYHLDKLRSYYSYSQTKKQQQQQQKKKPRSAPVTEKSTAAGAHHQEASQQKKNNKKRRMEEDVLGTGLGISDSFYYYSGFAPRWGKRRAAGSRSVDGVKLLDLDGGGTSQVELHREAGEAAAAAGEEDEYDGDVSSRDGKPLKSRPLSSLLQG